MSHIGRKGISNSFWKTFNKDFPAACIHLHNYDLFEKARSKLSPFIQNCVQQVYLPESYARYLPFYQKCQKNVAPTSCGLLASSPQPLWENLGMRENPTQQPKNCSSFLSEKSPLIDLNLSLSKVSFTYTIFIRKTNLKFDLLNFSIF